MGKLSIIVSIYNIEKYLSKCIESLLQQSNLNYEIILVDDGSTDNSSEICKQYAEKNSCIRYFRKSNGGLSSARNYGLQKSTGDYILFFDGDDYIDKNCLEKAIKALDSNMIDILQFGYREVDDKGRILTEENFQDYGFRKDEICTGTEWIKKRKFITMPWAYIFRKNFLTKNKLEFLDGVYHEDEEFTIKAIILSDKIMFLGYNIYNYVIRNGSIMRSTNIKKAYDLVLIVESLNKFKGESQLNEYDIVFIDKRLNYLYTCSLQIASNQKKLKEFLKNNDIRENIIKSMQFKKNIKHTFLAMCIKTRLYFLVDLYFKINRG